MINDKFKEDFKRSSDYNKLNQIIQQYLVKYQRDLDRYESQTKPLSSIKEQINKNIVALYKSVAEKENI